MKNTLKKVLSLFTAILMTITLGTTSIRAEADQNTGFNPDATQGTLTLTKHEESKENSTFSIYKVLDAKVEGTSTVYTYSWNTDFERFEKDYPAFTLDKIDDLVNGSPNYSINANSADQLAASLEKFVKDNNGLVSSVESNATVDTPYTLDIGYYLIVENITANATSDGAQMKPMLVAIPLAQQDGDVVKYNYNVEVTLKDKKLSTNKLVGEVDKEKVKESIAQQIGKVYEYEITQDVPKFDTSVYKNVVFKITDSMSKGLEFVGENNVKAELLGSDGSKIKDLILGTDYIFNKIGDSASGTTLSFDFSGNKYEGVKDGNTIKISYQAKITKDATFKPSGQPNTVTTEVGPNPDSTITTKPEYAIVYSANIDLKKVDPSGKTLTGAEFTVYEDKNCTKPALLGKYTMDDSGNITVDETLTSKIEVGSDGIARFAGFGEGTYYIAETQTPGGYVGLDDPIKVVVKANLPDAILTGTESVTFDITATINGNDVTKKIDANSASVKFEITNAKGFTLPTTGGIGTYVFTIGGAVLILAAVVLFVRSRKETK